MSAVKRLQRNLIGIESAETLIFSDFQRNGPMWSGAGPRVAIRGIRYSEPFRSLRQRELARHRRIGA
ncbi:hypothetical protein [Tropicimonas sp. IMCC6043]|uniref:hypothetical protein n=1 Tax=Tropicimonas sp. IMCC6043 TaxID=2510645 RepID=UPI001F5CE43C|nr:hypothetical protein [Tropicimonas sp. IMCC6043]